MASDTINIQTEIMRRSMWNDADWHGYWSEIALDHLQDEQGLADAMARTLNGEAINLRSGRHYGSAPDFAVDLMNHALGEVDYHIIARAFIAEVKEASRAT